MEAKQLTKKKEKKERKNESEERARCQTKQVKMQRRVNWILALSRARAIVSLP